MALTKLTQNLIDGTIVTSVNGSSGAVTLETGTDWQTAIQTSNFTAVASKGYFVNTTSAEITVTLPVGVVGTEIVIQDYAGTFATNNLILTANGSEKIQGNSTDDFKCETNNATVTLIYQDATKGWTADNIKTNAVLPALTVKYLVVAGGGSGGQAGGGGAGGYLTNYTGTALTLTAGQNYTVTVGAGATGNTNSIGSDGSNSIFYSIESTGGGGGAGQGAATANGFGRPGGSGGGAGRNDGGGGAGGAASPAGQGNAGGGKGTGTMVGGGGGGAGAVGVNGTGSSNPGGGGNGLTNAITVASGTGPYYAGGGAGGAYPPGAAAYGGSGGGGNGGYSGQTATSGTNNTGGGGGAPGLTASGNLNGNSGNGGSGIVILRYPSAYAISGLSGTTITVGTDEVTTFTAGTGNIQFN